MCEVSRVRPQPAYNDGFAQSSANTPWGGRRPTTSGLSLSTGLAFHRSSLVSGGGLRVKTSRHARSSRAVPSAVVDEPDVPRSPGLANRSQVLDAPGVNSVSTARPPAPSVGHSRFGSVRARSRFMRSGALVVFGILRYVGRPGGPARPRRRITTSTVQRARVDLAAEDEFGVDAWSALGLGSTRHAPDRSRRRPSSARRWTRHRPRT